MWVMSLYKHTIVDNSTRDIDSDNILKEKRTEKKSIFGIVYRTKVSDDKSEYVKIEKKRVGYGS